MAFEKILTHPDRNVITRMLLQGDGVRTISKYLKNKYPDDKSKQITPNLLQQFRSQKLNVEGKALEAIKDMAKTKHIKMEVQKEDTKIRNMTAFKEKLEEVATYHVDLQKELTELLILIRARTEDLFNKAASGQITINEEANLQRYLQSWTTTIERWAKYIEKIADKTVETNVNITVIEDQMSIIREAIRETLSELSPEVAIKFLDKLNSKMSSLSYRPPKKVEFGEIRTDVQLLTQSIIGVEDED